LALPVSSLSFRLRLPPTSPLFPYTTLFRSALPGGHRAAVGGNLHAGVRHLRRRRHRRRAPERLPDGAVGRRRRALPAGGPGRQPDRKSTRLNSSHVKISYAVFCLKKKKDKR